MREFAIENASGEVYELNDLRNFFHDPSGLGFVRRASYNRVGNRYVMLSDGFDQAIPTGLIRFKDEPNSSAYQKYDAFARFMQDIPLVLHYRADKHFRMDVIPEVVEKTEIVRPLGLDIAVTFAGMSLWYENVEVSGADSTTLISDSMNESGCHIKISGPIENPTWSQTVGDTVITTGQVTASIADGEILHVRSDTNPYQIYKTDGNGAVTDLYASSNWSTSRFVLLRNGANVIACTGASAITVQGRIEYETV